MGHYRERGEFRRHHGHLERGNSRFSPNDPDWQANFR